MIRDMDFIRECLLDIENNSEPLDFYPIINIMVDKGYETKYSFAQLLLMEDAGLFNKVSKDLSYGFFVNGLSNKGYDFLEKIKNENVWKKTKSEIEKRKLPKTIEFIAQIAGVFCGELIKHKNNN